MSKFFKNTTNLRVRFALGFSILVTLFLALILLFIYISFAGFRKEDFYNRLRDKTLTTFKLLVEVEQIDQELLQVIDKNTLNSLYDEKIMIFKGSTLIYSSIDDRKINHIPELFKKAVEKKEYHTTQGTDEVIALHPQNAGNYILLAAGYDRYGRSKLTFLKWVMMVVFGCGLIIGWLSTYVFVKKIIKPLEKLKSNLTNINYNNLGIRLLEKGQGEEVDSLSATFNQLLARLQQAFSFQKDFVHYASHELRTPLAAMVSLTENSMNKPMSVEELQEALKELYQQQKNLADITNSLLVLSDNKNNFSTLDYPAVRLDELVFRSVEIIKNIYPDARIEVNLEGELSNENSLLIYANEPLILMAFNNLLKNALQYATDSKVTLVVNSTQNGKEVRFLNAGKPFNEQEKEKLFTPFFRASNAAAVKGHGLGLPLVRQIIQLHKALITYSHNDGFNEFKIVFPS